MPSFMEATQWVGPLILFLLMVAVGIELTPADFRRIVAAPRAVIAGTLAQIALLPLLTWAVVALLELDPRLAAGAILVAVSPGAGISNILVATARANVALSVSLTAFASVLCVLTLPTIAAFGMRHFLGETLEVDVPVGYLMGQLTLALLLPIAIGMRWRALRPEFVDRHRQTLQRVALGTIAVFTALGAVFGDAGDLTFDDAAAGMLAAGVWAVLAMAVGWGLAALLDLPSEDRFAYLIEFSTRNIAVAAIVAMSGLGRIDLVLYSAAYIAVAYPLAAAVSVGRRVLLPPSEDAAASSAP
jgi:BASS family bile acid:Na+ symporter